MANNNKVTKCSECPFFEGYFQEYEEGYGLVLKGRCRRVELGEIWELRTPCGFAEDHTLEELEQIAFN
jgi:hypothetical protein